MGNINSDTYSHNDSIIKQKQEAQNELNNELSSESDPMINEIKKLSLNEKQNDDFIKKFIEKLDSLGHNGKDICSLLIPDKTVISGSFCLQVLTNESYDNSDIDIFTFDSKPFEEYLLSHSYKVNDDPYQNKNFTPYNQRITAINKVTTYIKNDSKVPIQVILINNLLIDKINPKNITHDSMNQYISNYFDLDICKFIFDGTNVINYDEYIIKNKKCTFSFSTCLRKEAQICATWFRIKKYTERGFNIEVTK